MSRHLPGKISRLIGDFNTICDLVDLIEHELEKRIVARHGLVKLDALLQLLPRFKNEIRLGLFGGAYGPVAEIERLIARLRLDYTGSDMEAGRDAITAHALKLDLKRISDTWLSMGEATFGVLRSDLSEIDAELKRLSSNYISAPLGVVEATWRVAWADERLLGPPDKPRLAVVYPGLATAGIVAPLPGGHAVQDVVIRTIGLATFLRQVRLLWEAVTPGSTADRLLAEIALNDFLALWELLFSSNVRNEHGVIDQSLLDHWQTEGWAGASSLATLQSQAHPDLAQWRQHRNKFTAHIDADEDIWKGDLGHWPFSPEELFNEALAKIEAVRESASHDMRSRYLFAPPTRLEGAVGLAAQDGRYWRDA